MGQHVYVELDLGQEDENTSGGIWIASYMVDQTDPDHPFVWKDVNGRLKKQEVKIGEVREEISKVCIVEGLELTDSICIPDESLYEGMKTAPMSEKPDENEDGSQSGEEGDEGIEGAEEGEFVEDEFMMDEDQGSEDMGLEEYEEEDSIPAEEMEYTEDVLPEGE